MAKVSQAEFLKRYQQGIANAGSTFEHGVDNSKDWAANYSSSDAQQRMAQGLQNAINEGKPAAGAQALGTTGWRSATKAKSGNYTGSASRAATNISGKVADILAAGDAASAAAKSVTGPKNRSTAKAKMSAAIDAIMDHYGKD